MVCGIKISKDVYPCLSRSGNLLRKCSEPNSQGFRQVYKTSSGCCHWGVQRSGRDEEHHRSLLSFKERQVMPKVLFLCTGNSARSQMAEGLMRSLGLGLWEVKSGGLLPSYRPNPK